MERNAGDGKTEKDKIITKTHPLSKKILKNTNAKVEKEKTKK